MTIEFEECWLRWRRGERIEVLAKENGVTRERMRYRLKKMDQTHPAMFRDAVLEEAAQALEAWEDMYGDAAAKTVRALKNQNPETAGGDK